MFRVQPAAVPETSGEVKPTPEDPEPIRPIEPDAGECCGEGCVNCILDIYDAALERYEVQLAAWRVRQSHQDADERMTGLED